MAQGPRGALEEIGVVNPHMATRLPIVPLLLLALPLKALLPRLATAAPAPLWATPVPLRVTWLRLITSRALPPELALAERPVALPLTLERLTHARATAPAPLASTPMPISPAVPEKLLR